MKVRLIAEEYSRHASLRARIPAGRVALLCGRLRLPLAGRAGIRPCDSLRLCGKTLQPGVAGAALTRSCSAPASAPRRAGDEGPSHEGRFVRLHRCHLVGCEGQATCLRDGSPTRTESRESCSCSRYSEAAGSASVTAEPAATTAAAFASTPQPAATATEPTASISASALAISAGLEGGR